MNQENETEGTDDSQAAAEEPVEGGPSPGAPPEVDDLAGSESAPTEEAPDEAVVRLESELAESRDRYLRLAADHDNFRKRIKRERAETWGRAQADVVTKLLDALDDLGRVTQLDLQQAAPADVLTGVEMVERKILKELESAGLERVGEPGERFDPNVHEAVGTVPAETAEDDQLVGDVFQIGYRFAGALLRPARVRVRVWTDGTQ